MIIVVGYSSPMSTVANNDETSTASSYQPYFESGTASAFNQAIDLLSDIDLPSPEIKPVSPRYAEKVIRYKPQRVTVDNILFHRQLMNDSPGQCSPANWRKRGKPC